MYMKKSLLYTLIIAGILCLTACQSIEQVSIDYMLPAEITFPNELKRVAIVNNMPETPENKLIASDKKTGKSSTELARRTDYYNGEAKLTTESMAQAIADENYFDLVVICDSALRSHDITPRESTLSQSEVQQLTQELGVDFLIALENVQLSSLRKVSYMPGWNLYYGTVDAKVYPTLKIYLPNRSAPMATVNCTDSIFWEATGDSQTQIFTQLVPEKELIEQASSFAGIAPVKYLVPHWQTANRYLFKGGSVNMRDADVCVKEKDWAGAIELWEKEYERQKGKQKMYAACNIAFGYEIQDSLDLAYDWAVKAREIAQSMAKDVAKEIKDAAEGIYTSEISYYIMTNSYVNELKTRKDGLVRLNAQMKRNNADF